MALRCSRTTPGRIASAIRISAATSPAQDMNPYNRRQDRGDCNFDIRHIFNTSIVARSPVVGSGLMAHLLGNWQLAPLIRALSGVPLNITTGTDASLTGVGLDRPNLVPGVNPYNAVL